METELVKLNPKWLSSGGEGVTNSITGEPVPEVKESHLEFDCPCGCGDKICIPTIKGFGHEWTKTNESSFETLTITPSIRRMSGCKTHMVITNGKITP